MHGQLAGGCPVIYGDQRELPQRPAAPVSSECLAAILMTGDHALKMLGLGDVPGVAELGGLAFHLFASVLA